MFPNFVTLSVQNQFTETVRFLTEIKSESTVCLFSVLQSAYLFGLVSVAAGWCAEWDSAHVSFSFFPTSEIAVPVDVTIIMNTD